MKRLPVQRFLGLALLLVLAPLLRADEGEGKGKVTDVTLMKGARFGANVAFGGPLMATLTGEMHYGLVADVKEGTDRVRAVGGLVVQLHAGTGGGKLSVGAGARARVEESDFHGTVGAALKISLARTWGSPLGTEPGITYLGPELGLEIKRVNVELGALARIGGDPGAGAVFSWSIGWRL
jgi:hypothetical protein